MFPTDWFNTSMLRERVSDFPILVNPGTFRHGAPPRRSMLLYRHAVVRYPPLHKGYDEDVNNCCKEWARRLSVNPEDAELREGITSTTGMHDVLLSEELLLTSIVKALGLTSGDEPGRSAKPHMHCRVLAFMMDSLNAKKAATLSPHHDSRSGGPNGVALPILTAVVTLIYKVDTSGKVGELVDPDTANEISSSFPGIKFTQRNDVTRKQHVRAVIYPGQASVYLMTGLVNASGRHEVAPARDILEGTQRYVRFSVPFFVFWPKSA